MSKKIAILRGINVGGKRKILMADLRQLFEKLGFSNIATYIQSGNVIFEATNRSTDIEMATEIEKAILEEYGFVVPVIVKSKEEIVRAVEYNPFYQDKEADIKALHLTFLKESPSSENLAKTATYDYSPDKFVIKDKSVFIFCEGKYHKSKLTNNFFEKKLKVAATTRNWKTVLKLLELSQ